MKRTAPLPVLSWLLGGLPPRLLQALDAWSRRVALKKAARRRELDAAAALSRAQESLKRP